LRRPISLYNQVIRYNLHNTSKAFSCVFFYRWKKFINHEVWIWIKFFVPYFYFIVVYVSQVLYLQVYMPIWIFNLQLYVITIIRCWTILLCFVTHSAYYAHKHITISKYGIVKMSCYQIYLLILQEFLFLPVRPWLSVFSFVSIVSVLRSRSIFARLQLGLRLQLVKNSGSTSDHFPHTIKKNSTIFMVSKNFHVF
jgi:hypothetical protein